MPSKIRHLLILAAPLAAAFAASPATAQSFQSIDALEEQVTASLGVPIGQPGGPARPIDRRLKLTACPAPVIVEPIALGAVTVRCQQIGWRLRVPVVQGGETAGARPAAPASMMRAARAEPIIRRGDPVALVVVSGSFTVSRQAVAEQDGAPGDRIRVRTEPRKPPIIGQVMPDGRVAMGGLN
ncbi:MAG TPA: flagella basal body P-ring formation protein FlgA [Allosphingosinicella sp.]|jgi:flagella basal body P-ring formation protein FlgA